MSINGKGGRWTTVLLVAGVMLFVFGLAGLIDDRFVLSHDRVVMTLGAGLLTVGYLTSEPRTVNESATRGGRSSRGPVCSTAPTRIRPQHVT